MSVSYLVPKFPSNFPLHRWETRQQTDRRENQEPEKFDRTGELVRQGGRTDTRASGGDFHSKRIKIVLIVYIYTNILCHDLNCFTLLYFISNLGILIMIIFCHEPLESQENLLHIFLRIIMGFFYTTERVYFCLITWFTIESRMF